MNLGSVPALVGRISFTGDLGYEMWVEPAYLAPLFDLLTEAGVEHGMALFGGHALNSLRLEKSYGSWASEYRPIYDPYEAGLGMFVRPDKGDFIGRDAVRAVREAGPMRTLCAFRVDVPPGPDAADVIGDEPISHGGKVIGWVTSGGYAHHSGVSVALGYVPVAVAENIDGFEIEILGEHRTAQRLPQCLFDPGSERMRG